MEKVMMVVGLGGALVMSFLLSLGMAWLGLRQLMNGLLLKSHHDRKIS